jgi:hypothetical protein
MRHLMIISALGVVLALALSGCASGSSSTTTNAVVSTLASLVGVSTDQATAGAGALLGLASEKLAPGDYAKVAATIPGASGLVQKAGEMTGLGNKFGSMANVTTALGKVGLNSGQVQSMATNLTDIVGKSGGESVKSLLTSALK